MTQVESVDGENSMGIQGWDLTHHQTYSMAEYGYSRPWTRASQPASQRHDLPLPVLAVRTQVVG